MVAPDVASVVAQVDAAFDALAAVDPSALPDQALRRLVLELQRLTSRLASVRAEPVAAWVAREVWRDDNSKAAWARLARDADLHPAAAKVEVRRPRNSATCR